MYCWMLQHTAASNIHTLPHETCTHQAISHHGLLTIMLVAVTIARRPRWQGCSACGSPPQVCLSPLLDGRPSGVYLYARLVCEMTSHSQAMVPLKTGDTLSESNESSFAGAPKASALPTHRWMPFRKITQPSLFHKRCIREYRNPGRPDSLAGAWKMGRKRSPSDKL